MKQITLDDACDYFHAATIHQSTPMGPFVVHIGESETGHPFVLVFDAWAEKAALIESL